MEPNNLVVSVLSARGLALKGHNKIDAYVSLSLSGPGSWKSKVQTDIRKTTGNCEWNQRCEFVVYGLDSVLTVTANHKTVLGTAECIGVIEFQLRQQYGKMAPMWFRLRKKGKANEDLATQKYRGELLLKFEFSNKLSTSMTSLNTVHGSSALSALKRKMHLGKKDDRDTVSMAAGLPSSYSKVFGRGSPQPTAGAGINFNSLQRNPRAATISSDGGSELQQAGFDRSGLIVPPLKAQNSIGSSSDRMTPEQQQQQLEDGSYRSTPSNNNNSNNNRSRTSSPTSAVSDFDDFNSANGRPLSTTSSSGFGSSKSAQSVNDTLNKKIRQSPSFMSTLMAKNRSLRDGKKLSYDEMEKMLNEMQIELARHEEKEKSLNEYIETLLTRIMDQNPNLLEAVTLATRKQSQRKRTTMP